MADVDQAQRAERCAWVDAAGQPCTRQALSHDIVCATHARELEERAAQWLRDDAS